MKRKGVHRSLVARWALLLRGYRTLILSAAIAALGFLQAFDFTQIISNPRTIGIILIIIGVLVAVLRAITTTHIGDN